MKTTGYIYSTETMEVIAEITGETKAIEKYADEHYDESCGLTFTPAFGYASGLIDTTSTEYIEL